MTLEKAIEILHFHHRFTKKQQQDDTADAIELGIEALKTIKGLRTVAPYREHAYLPGETKE